jgi:predicted acyltransferase
MKQAINSTRLYSLDALRGFDMFWIIGAERFFHELSKITGAPFWQALSNQFVHLEWEGFVFYDLIFPLFLFLAGVSVPYSFGKHFEAGMSKQQVSFRAIKRGFILIIFGYIMSNGLQILPLEEIRFTHVLSKIGISYMFACLIYIYAKPNWQKIWFVSLLLAYWLLLLFTSAPGFPMGDMTLEGNFATYIDAKILPGRLYLYNIHEPEGPLTHLGSIPSALIGIFIGVMLKNTSIENRKKTTMQIAVGGAVFIIVALIWSFSFPIVKYLWTSSYSLLCAGLSMILMALFYYIIDIKGYKKWAFFFKVIGMNSIFIYMAPKFINWKYTTNAFFKWFGQIIGEQYDSFALVFCFLAIQWCVLYLMYKKKIFLRV